MMHWTPKHSRSLNEHYTQYVTARILNYGQNVAALKASAPLWEGFLSDFAAWLQGFVPIQPQEYRGWAKMLCDRARLTVGVPIHPKGVGWEWGQGLCVDQSGFHNLVHRGIFILKQEIVFSKVLPKSHRQTLYLNIPIHHFFPPAWHMKSSPRAKVYVLYIGGFTE